MGYAREAPSLVFNLYCRSYSGCPVWVNVNIERVVILRSILFEILQDLSLKITLLFQFLLVFCPAALLLCRCHQFAGPTTHSRHNHMWWGSC